MNFSSLDDWLWALGSMAGALIVGVLVYVVLRPVVRRLSRHATVARSVVAQLDKPLRYALPLMTLQVATEGASDNLTHIEGVRQAVSLCLIAAFTWAAMAAV